MRSMASEIKEFRLRYLCAATGALGALSACAPELMEILDRRARFEVDTVNLQELQDNMQATRDEENSTRSIRSCEEKLY